MSYDRKSQTGAHDGSSPVINPLEFVKNLRQAIFGNAPTII
jgi:hypothetical protein